MQKNQEFRNALVRFEGAKQRDIGDDALARVDERINRGGARFNVHRVPFNAARPTLATRTPAPADRGGSQISDIGRPRISGRWRAIETSPAAFYGEPAERRAAEEKGTGRQPKQRQAGQVCRARHSDKSDRDCPPMASQRDWMPARSSPKQTPTSFESCRNILALGRLGQRGIAVVGLFEGIEARQRRVGDAEAGSDVG
jgi:hypothetical protein